MWIWLCLVVGVGVAQEEDSGNGSSGNGLWVAAEEAKGEGESEGQHQWLAEQEVDDADAALVALQAELLEAHGEAGGLAELVGQAATLLDDRKSDADRIAAAAVLAEVGDSRAVPFVRSAGLSLNQVVQMAAIDAIPSFGAAEAASLGAAVLRMEDGYSFPQFQSWSRGISQVVTPRRVSQVLTPGGVQAQEKVTLREKVLEMMVALADDEAASRLWIIAGDSTVSDQLRDASLVALETGYADWLALKGGPIVVSGFYGPKLGMAANAVTGGFALHSIGVWSQNEEAEVIGGVGGAAIGIGTAALYSLEQPISDGQGLVYASGVGLGGTAGLLAGLALSGYDYDSRDSRGLEAGLRLAGFTGGAWYGYERMKDHPAVSDVLEMDAVAYLGAQMTIGVGDLFRDHSEEHVDWDDEYFDEEWEEGDLEDAARSRDLQIDSALGLVGMAAGLGVGHRIIDDWQPSDADIGVASVAAIEGAILGALLPVAFTGDDVASLEGNVRTGLHAAAIGGLYYAHKHDIDYGHTSLGAYSLAVGSALGAGLPMALSPLVRNEDQAIALGVSALGAAGTVAGIRLADQTQWSTGDFAMVGVGLSLALWESTAYAYVADEKWNLYKDNLQIPATILLATGGTGLGLAVMAHHIDPDPANMLFLGTATAWGAYYGALIPIALETEGTTPDYILTILGASDLALGLGAWAVSERGFLDPRNTLRTQLGGVAGATLGAMGVSMTPDPSGSGIASGALIGATVGMIGGALVERDRQSDSTVQRAGERMARHLDLPGDWAFSVQPMPTDDGEIGTWMGLRVDGW